MIGEWTPLTTHHSLLTALLRVYPQLLDLAGERVAPDAEQRGRLDATPARVRQGLHDERALEFARERIGASRR